MHWFLGEGTGECQGLLCRLGCNRSISTLLSTNYFSHLCAYVLVYVMEHSVTFFHSLIPPKEGKDYEGDELFM